jgi:tetratricopeptide (TPR) repeat protein
MTDQPMATVRCGECGNTVRRRAGKCPWCGAPINNNVRRSVASLRWLWVISAAVVILAAAILIAMVLGRPHTGNETQEATSRQRDTGDRGVSHAVAPRQNPPDQPAPPRSVPDGPGQSPPANTGLRQAAIDAFGLGKTHLEKGDYDLAIREFTEAVRQDPNYHEAFANRAFAYLCKADYDRAIQDYGQAIRLKPSVDLFANRALAYFNKRDYDGAIRDYDQAIRLSSSDAELFNDRGAAYSGKGDYDRAIQDYDQAVRLNPNYPAALNNRGWAYSQKGQRERAIADYRSALRLKPEDSLRRHVEAALKSLGVPATIVDRQ